MGINHQFKTIVYDSQVIPKNIPAGGSVEFFKDDTNQEITPKPQKTESQLIQWLFKNESSRTLIFNVLGIDERFEIFSEITEPLIQNPRKPPGDVDLLIFDDKKPFEAIAIEAKRIALKAFNTEKDDFRSLSRKVNVRYKKGIEQANGLRAIGFHKSYLAIILDADTRRRNQFNLACRFPTITTMDRAIEYEGLDALNKAVGLLLIVVAQTTNKPIEETGILSAYVERPPQKIHQPFDLTCRIDKVGTNIKPLRG